MSKKPAGRRTPGGQTRTGHLHDDSPPVGGTKGSDVEPIRRLEVETEESATAGGRRSGPTGLDPTADFEEPEHPYDGIHELGPVSDEED